MKTRNTVSLAITILLAQALSASPLPLAAQELYRPGCGRIEGRVFDQYGQPLGRVRVYSVVRDRPPRGTFLDTQTGPDGRFILDCPELGENGIYVSKEEDGYPDTFWTPFISPDLIPVVNVVDQEAIRRVEIRLGPKSGRLTLRLLDASSWGQVENATLILCRADDPSDCSWRGFPQNDDLSMLIPPIAVAIKVRAPGYEDWFYKKESSAARTAIGSEVAIEGGFTTPLRIRPTETKTLMVSLRPARK